MNEPTLTFRDMLADRNRHTPAQNLILAVASCSAFVAVMCICLVVVLFYPF